MELNKEIMILTCGKINYELKFTYQKFANIAFRIINRGKRFLLFSERREISQGVVQPLALSDCLVHIFKYHGSFLLVN